MHLKLSQCNSLFVRTCSGNHGNISRLPLTVLSTNTLQRKAPPPLRMYQTTRQDGDAPLDIWSVIKPGHVREKIAIFAPDGAASDEAGEGPGGGPSHAARAGKAKGSREGTCKRRRRSENNRNLQQDARTQVQGPQQPSLRRSGQRNGEAVKTEAEEEQIVSVVEMVAFLEQRASEQEPDSKLPLALQRSSACITLSRAPPPELRGEEPESIRVSDMVAKLESECLKRRTEGDLSRSNSLSRTVGRVLLDAGGHSPAPGGHSPIPCRPSSPSSLTSLPVAQSVGREPTSYSEPALITPPSGEAQGAEPLSSITEVPHEKAEPLPGLLFLSGPQASQPRPLHHIITFDTEPSPSQPHPPTARCDSGSQLERRRADGAPTEVCDAAPCRRAPESQDFLSLRRRLQRLLEPRPLLAALPPHLLLRLLRLLPTRSLAALKCSCRYFLFVIDHYGVRPADSLWVSDPRYRDDPCKQCKRRCGGGGDVSACRWHHKPYCQALPGGPGFWMCCRGARRDAPGCNVGLHDNRWVPAFHSINAPIYKRGRHDD